MLVYKKKQVIRYIRLHKKHTQKTNTTWTTNSLSKGRKTLWYSTRFSRGLPNTASVNWTGFSLQLEISGALYERDGLSQGGLCDQGLSNFPDGFSNDARPVWPDLAVDLLFGETFFLRPPIDDFDLKFYFKRFHCERLWRLI